MNGWGQNTVPRTPHPQLRCETLSGLPKRSLVRGPGCRLSPSFKSIQAVVTGKPGEYAALKDIPEFQQNVKTWYE
jgi:hypothetical protein